MKTKAQHVIYLYDEEQKAGEIVIDIEDDIYNICHTFVDDAYRGQGLAGKLMEEAVRYVDLHKGTFKADCSYAARYLDKHEIKHC